MGKTHDALHGHPELLTILVIAYREVKVGAFESLRHRPSRTSGTDQLRLSMVAEALEATCNSSARLLKPSNTIVRSYKDHIFPFHYHLPGMGPLWFPHIFFRCI
jgi:hypothetical protein